ncbi:hypothetical protein ES288_D02G054000v1 [Gossypium darwinii]|uniref:Aminotransferase-like plant mobile domain-containing protein n=1 Tax=Gossypium darwinii TaxID=34276 RepID=A0A5D2DDL0_GOSDA|nr:hypothetical protein ES288_D02G054000v1 [Gossypium darwinii]
MQLSLPIAFVERWTSKTLNFYFPSDEVTTTLKNVAIILIPPIESVVVTSVTQYDWWNADDR